MRSRYSLVAVISIIGFAAVLVLRVVDPVSPSSVMPTSSPSGMLIQADRVDVREDGNVVDSLTPEAAATQVTPREDGRYLLENHCTQCHVIQLLESIEKPLSEWEESLAQMEEMGVRLDDSEKDILLQYLAGAGKP